MVLSHFLNKGGNQRHDSFRSLSITCGAVLAAADSAHCLII